MYTTPKSYLELLKLFTSLLEKKHVEADAAIQRLEGGVLKLAESAEAVANLEENLKVITKDSCVFERISGRCPAAPKLGPAQLPFGYHCPFTRMTSSCKRVFTESSDARLKIRAWCCAFGLFAGDVGFSGGEARPGRQDGRSGGWVQTYGAVFPKNYRNLSRLFPSVVFQVLPCTSRRTILSQVRTEREGVGRETENANIEADKVAIIQNEVSRKQADAESDLAKAEPAVLAAMSALDTLDKSQLGQCKTMSVPPPGVVDIFIACMVGGSNGQEAARAKCRVRRTLPLSENLEPQGRNTIPTGHVNPACVGYQLRVVRILSQISTVGPVGDP